MTSIFQTDKKKYTATLNNHCNAVSIYEVPDLFALQFQHLKILNNCFKSGDTTSNFVFATLSTPRRASVFLPCLFVATLRYRDLTLFIEPIVIQKRLKNNGLGPAYFFFHFVSSELATIKNIYSLASGNPVDQSRS